MIIRPASADDLADINAVHEACGRRAWDPAVLDHSDDRLVVVAVVDGKIVAAAKTHHQSTPEGGAPQGYYLGGLAVHPSHRREGIGLALTRVRVEWVWARADTVHYFTDEDNIASLQMHAAFGFEEIARLPTILGAQANREHLVLFRATRPGDRRARATDRT
ncbi:GNAT family N-acetyltransferase [Microbacterium sp. NPDC058062]|uniref:GNAT family N-acetyltransferase n=1 Tax=Microbacterium sp. NPDC058062 TaxID=3346320 RepID=UPI0036DEAFF0